MSKARDLADFVSAGSPLADGTISVSEVSGAAPTASPTFTGDVTVSGDLTGLRYLDVYNTGSTSTDGALVRLITEQVGSTSTTSADIIKRKNGEFRITNFETDSAAYTAFNVGSSERMRIDSNGRVGIGVTAMNDATLEIQPATDIPQIKLTQNNVPDGGDGWKIHNSGPTGGNLAFIREGSGVDTEYFRFGISGQIGLSGANYGTSGQVLTSNGSSAAPSWQSVSFTTNVITGNTTATANNHYYLNDSAITLTLPASPSVGDEVRISEVAGNTDCVIGRNGSNIMSSGTDLTIDTGYTVIYLRYVDATIGWAFS